MQLLSQQNFRTEAKRHWLKSPAETCGHFINFCYTTIRKTPLFKRIIGAAHSRPRISSNKGFQVQTGTTFRLRRRVRNSIEALLHFRRLGTEAACVSRDSDSFVLYQAVTGGRGRILCRLRLRCW